MTQRVVALEKMKDWRMFIFLYLTLLQTFCDEEIIFRETKCNIEYQSGCASRVAATFEDKVLEERKEFTLIYKSQTKEETVAMCDWVKSGRFSCDPANGFKCDNQLSKNFGCDIDTTKCFNSGEFLFDVENMDTIRCEIWPKESNIGKVVMSTSHSNSEHQNKENSRLMQDQESTAVITFAMVLFSLATILYFFIVFNSIM